MYHDNPIWEPVVQRLKVYVSLQQCLMLLQGCIQPRLNAKSPNQRPLCKTPPPLIHDHM
jgi:hypothetical protein